MEKLKCFEKECKEKQKKIEFLSLIELEKLNIQCSNCGNWILKESNVANETYNLVSNLWAEKFNKKFFKK